MKYRRPVLLIAVFLCVSVLLYLLRPAPEPRLETRKLPDGSPLLQAIPDDQPQVRILLAVPEEQPLSQEQLLKLASENEARVVQVIFPAAHSCSVWSERLQRARKALGAEPDLVAGIDRGATFAWRWLANQNNAKAQAISAGFSAETSDCSSEPLPTAAKGQWVVAWNNSPDDDSALFVRNQPQAETIISPYDMPLPQVLFGQIKRALQGQADSIPVVEVPATSGTPSDTVTLFYSGDGGWRDLDRDIAERMAAKGFPVVGVDVLRYFWEHKSLEQGAADLEQLMDLYREKWGAKSFVLAGYSFGADLMPSFYNRLPQADRDQVKALLLLALARTGGLEIKVEGWLGKVDTEFATGPELTRLPAAKLYCVYGLEEQDESGCTQPQFTGEVLALPGGHHFDENYEALAEKLMQAIRQRHPQ